MMQGQGKRRALSPLMQGGQGSNGMDKERVGGTYVCREERSRQRR